MCSCVTVSGDWSKIKIQIERKYWNHHFCYRQLYSFLAPAVNKLLQGGGREGVALQPPVGRFFKVIIERVLQNCSGVKLILDIRLAGDIIAFDNEVLGP